MKSGFGCEYAVYLFVEHKPRKCNMFRINHTNPTCEVDSPNIHKHDVL